MTLQTAPHPPSVFLYLKQAWRDYCASGNAQTLTVTTVPTHAAAAVAQTFAIAPATQTISFGPLADKAIADPDFPVSATASSGLAVSFSATGSCTDFDDRIAVFTRLRR